MNGNEATIRLIAALEEAGVDYRLVDSLSSNDHGDSAASQEQRETDQLSTLC